MRALTLLSLVSGLLLAVSSAGAATVLGVTGVAANCLSTRGNLATGIVTTNSWIQTHA
jgi:hypothetical protein